MGVSHWAVQREGTSSWRLGVIHDECFYPGHGCSFYSRKYAGEMAIKKFSKYTEAEMKSIFLDSPAPQELRHFAEPERRAAPPPSFKQMLKRL